MFEVKCDKCEQKFEVKVKEKKLEGDVIWTYFKCPHCGNIFTVFYTNSLIRKLQREQRVLKSNKENEELFQSKRVEIKKLMDELKEKMEAEK